MKSSFVRLVIILVVIVVAVGTLVWLERIPLRRLASILGITVTVSDISKNVTPEPSVPLLADRVPSLSLGTVAIQTFSGTRLVRTAAAIAVTSDGLIITTATAAPYGTGTYNYWVVTSRGVGAAARRIAYDATNALVLLRTDAADLGTVPFNVVIPRAGDILTAIGASVTASQHTPLVLPVSVVSAVDEHTIALSLDRTFLNALAGARLVDRTGQTIGLLRSGTVPGIIPASAINAFVDRYLESSQ